MMKWLLLSALLFLLAAATGCRGTEPLINRWVHSYEEDSAGVHVYRPHGYSFPAARGRDAWDLDEYGFAVRYAVGDVEGIARDSGNWHLSEDGMLTIATAGSRRPMRYQLEYVDSTVMRLKVLR